MSDTSQPFGNIAQLQFQQSYLSLYSKFTKDHEWIEYDTTTKIGKIGITKFAQGELGDIVHVDIKEVGQTFTKGDGITAIESVKTAADVYAPVTGEVISQNQKVKDDPALVNSDSETDGWLIQVKISDEKDLSDLMDEKQYEKFLEESKH
eukprot:403333119